MKQTKLKNNNKEKKKEKKNRSEILGLREVPSQWWISRYEKDPNKFS